MHILQYELRLQSKDISRKYFTGKRVCTHEMEPREEGASHWKQTGLSEEERRRGKLENSGQTNYCTEYKLEQWLSTLSSPRTPCKYLLWPPTPKTQLKRLNQW